MASPPLALIVTVEIDPNRLDEFIEVMRGDAAGSRKEAGCYRFDLLRDAEQKNKFVFFEVYKEPTPPHTTQHTRTHAQPPNYPHALTRTHTARTNAHTHKQSV
jgi:quinol monooxygenase YgiN